MATGHTVFLFCLFLACLTILLGAPKDFMFWGTVSGQFDQFLFVFPAPARVYGTLLYSASIIVFPNWETLWFSKTETCQKGKETCGRTSSGAVSGGRTCSRHLLTHAVDLWIWEGILRPGSKEASGSSVRVRKAKDYSCSATLTFLPRATKIWRWMAIFT